jgi:DNA-binding NarL/FixJ family response regulator
LQTLSQALQGYPELRVVGTARDGRRAVSEILKVRPQLVVLDLELPSHDGIQVTRRLKRRAPEIEILIWTVADDEKRVYEAVRAGASGYLMKRVGPERIRTAIHQVMEGGMVIEPLIARRFWTYFRTLQQLGTSSTQHDWKLTEREVEILGFLAKGLSNAEVGSVLAMGRRSVRTHLAHIYQRMGVRTQVEAVVLALRAGLIQI